MGPAFLIRSTGRIRRLVETEYDTKHPIILDGRHTVVKLIVSDIHYRYQHQLLDYLRDIIHLEFAILNLRSLLKSIEVLICRKRKAKTERLEGLVTASLPSQSVVLIILDPFTSQSGGVLKNDGASFLHV